MASSVDLKPGDRSFTGVSQVSQGLKDSGCLSLLPVTLADNWIKSGAASTKPAPTWDVGTLVNGLTCYTPALAPKALIAFFAFIVRFFV